MELKDISTPAKVAGILSIAAFFVTFHSYSSTLRNGVVTSCDYIDYGALFLGGAAAAIGLYALATGLSRRHGPTLGISVGAVLLGLYHILSGLGQIGSPCG